MRTLDSALARIVLPLSFLALAPLSMSCAKAANPGGEGGGDVASSSSKASSSSQTSSSSGTGGCMAGFADCDNDATNGCEADLASDPLHCGSCATACPSQGGTATCSKSMCSLACDATHDDCNADPTDGCEADLTTVSDCGKCKNACPAAPNAQAACVNQQCTLSCFGTNADCNMDIKDGCEVNLDIDDHNCGKCGHDCNGASCGNSICKPILLAQALGTPAGLFIDGGYLYYTEGGSMAGGFLDGKVSRLPLAGGPVELLASPLEAPASVIVDATNAYVACAGNGGAGFSDGSIISVPKAGGAVTKLVPVVQGAFTLVTNGTALFGGGIDPNMSLGSVFTVPLPNGPLSTLVPNAGSVYGVAMDATNIYYSDFFGGGVNAVPIAGGNPKVIAASTGTYSVAVDATNVYFSNNTSVDSAPIAGGASTQLAQTTLASYVYVDGADLYFSDFASFGTPTGTVSKVPVAGGAVTQLATGLNTPFALVTDAQFLYIAEYGTGASDGAIRKVPK